MRQESVSRVADSGGNTASRLEGKMQRLVQTEPREHAGVFNVHRCWCEQGGTPTHDETLLLVFLFLTRTSTARTDTTSHLKY